MSKIMCTSCGNEVMNGEERCPYCGNILMLGKNTKVSNVLLIVGGSIIFLSTFLFSYEVVSFGGLGGVSNNMFQTLKPISAFPILLMGILGIIGGILGLSKHKSIMPIRIIVPAGTILFLLIGEFLRKPSTEDKEALEILQSYGTSMQTVKSLGFYLVIIAIIICVVGLLLQFKKEKS